MRHHLRIIGIVTLAILGMIAAISAGPAIAQDASPTPDAYGGELQKEVLAADDEVPAAPGEILTLTRYIIPAGAELPVHTHPGVQIASVELGTFTYHVLEGEVFVTRADGTEETFGSGSTITFEVGDSWVEPEGMIHYAQNLTDSEVILISSALMDEGQNPTILVDLTATPEATPAS